MKYTFILVVVFFILLSLTAIIPDEQTQAYSLSIQHTGSSLLLRDEATLEILEEFADASEAFDATLSQLPQKGGSLTLSAGDFLLGKSLYLKSHMKLTGSGPGTRLILQSQHENGIGIVCDTLDKVVVSDLTLVAAQNGNSRIGIQLDHCGDCLVKDVHAIGFQEYGILLKNRSFLSEIRGCRATDNWISGICLKDLDSRGRGGDWVPNLVTNCIVYGGQAGIECDRALVANIIGCEIYQTRGPGFLIHNRSNSVLLSSNRTFQIQDDAVVVDDSHEVNINGNMLSWHEGHGIVLRNVIWGSVSGNNIIDSGSKNFWEEQYQDNIRGHLLLELPADFQPGEHMKYGVWLADNSQGITLSSNAIFNWGNVLPMINGIYEDSSCSFNIASANNINYTENELVQMNGENSLSIDNIGLAEESLIKASQSQNLHIFNTDKIRRFADSLKAVPNTGE